MRPRTCCAAFSNFHTERGVAEFYAHLLRLQSFCDPVNGNLSRCLNALAAPNLKDRSKTTSRFTRFPERMGYGGQFCPRGEILLAVQWIVRSGRYFLLYRLSAQLRGERYGLCYGPSNNCASFDTAGRGFIPYREAHCLLLATFLTLARFIESSKSAARQSRSFSTT